MSQRLFNNQTLGGLGKALKKKSNALVKVYSAKDWAKLSRGLSKANATAELEELKSL